MKLGVRSFTVFGFFAATHLFGEETALEQRLRKELLGFRFSPADAAFASVTPAFTAEEEREDKTESERLAYLTKEIAAKSMEATKIRAEMDQMQDSFAKRFHSSNPKNWRAAAREQMENHEAWFDRTVQYKSAFETEARILESSRIPTRRIVAQSRQIPRLPIGELVDRTLAQLSTATSFSDAEIQKMERLLKLIRQSHPKESNEAEMLSQINAKLQIFAKALDQTATRELERVEAARARAAEKARRDNAMPEGCGPRWLGSVAISIDFTSRLIDSMAAVIGGRPYQHGEELRRDLEKASRVESESEARALRVKNLATQMQTFASFAN